MGKAVKAQSARGIMATKFGGFRVAVQRVSERAVSTQEADTSLDGKPKAAEELPGAEDMFGGLTLSGASEGKSLI